MTYPVEKPDFTTFSAIALVEQRNAMIEEINAITGSNMKPIRMYQNREKGRANCERMWAELAKARGAAPVTEEDDVAGALAMLNAGRPANLGEGDSARVSPGMARLGKNPAAAEAIRQKTVADQEAARAQATEERASKETTIVAKTATAAKAPKASKAAPKAPKAPKAAKAPTENKARPRLYTIDQKITLMVDNNPKRGACAARFDVYHSGMTVGDYLAKVGGKHSSDLKWDVEHGFIKIA